MSIEKDWRNISYLREEEEHMKVRIYTENVFKNMTDKNDMVIFNVNYKYKEKHEKMVTKMLNPDTSKSCDFRHF